MTKTAAIDTRTCAVNDCVKARSGRSVHCGMHQARLYRAGTTDPGPLSPRPVEERFWAKVDKSGECWLWTGHRNESGYGQFAPQRVAMYAHRWAYEQAHGSIGDGMVVRHSCDTPACVRIDHLLVGTQAENIADMWARGRQGAHLGRRRQ